MQNYFSVGVDAEVARRFDAARTAKPEAFRSALGNKVKYALFGSSLALRGAASLDKRVASLKIDGIDVDLPTGVKSVVLLNIPSFAAGTHPWGEGGYAAPSAAAPRCGGGCHVIPPGHHRRLFAPPASDDGLLEVVAMFGVLHAASLQVPVTLSALRGYGAKRLGQGRRVELHFRTAAQYEDDAAARGKRADARVSLATQVDGEAWSFPWSGEAVTVSLKGKVGVVFGPRHTAPPDGMPARWPSARTLALARHDLDREDATPQTPSAGILRPPVIS
jgi:hypothetical protein